MWQDHCACVSLTLFIPEIDLDKLKRSLKILLSAKVKQGTILYYTTILYTDVYTGQPQALKCGLIGGPVSRNKIINDDYI